jgi:hypothetical protein
MSLILRGRFSVIASASNRVSNFEKLSMVASEVLNERLTEH